MKYIVRIDYHIEARDTQSAEESLMFNNTKPDKELTFDTFEVAYDNYCDVLKMLPAPKELKYGLYWFSGAVLESYQDDGEYNDLSYAEVKRGENE